MRDINQKPLNEQSPMTKWIQGFESNGLGGYTPNTLIALPYLIIPEVVYRVKAWNKARKNKKELKGLTKLLNKE